VDTLRFWLPAAHPSFRLQPRAHANLPISPISFSQKKSRPRPSSFDLVLCPQQKRRALQPRWVWVLADAGGSAGPRLLLPLPPVTTSRLLCGIKVILALCRIAEPYPVAFEYYAVLSARPVRVLPARPLCFGHPICSSSHLHQWTGSFGLGRDIGVLFFLRGESSAASAAIFGKNARPLPAKQRRSLPVSTTTAMLAARQKTPVLACVPRQDNGRAAASNKCADG
jgi:hypothetical protein